jgi:hypothetical protein
VFGLSDPFPDSPSDIYERAALRSRTSITVAVEAGRSARRAPRREVLTRLLNLNHERYAEEVHQGLHEKKKPRGRKVGWRKGNKAPRRMSNGGQMKLV